MRRVLFPLFAVCVSMPASAVDAPAKTDLPFSAPSGINWGGLYFGGHWGYSTGLMKWRDPQGYYKSAPDVSADGRNDGLLGGAQIGYNKQHGALVVGIEADIDTGRLLGYATCGATSGVGGSGDTCGNRTELMASLTGRLGYAAGRSLFYAKGGGAYARDRTAVTNTIVNPIPAANNSANRYGWTIGGGIAYAMDPKWSVYAEYGFYDFGNRSYVSGAGVNAGAFNVAHVQHAARFGLNYRLGDAGGVGAARAISDNITGEFGTRAGYSTGSFKKYLYDPITRSQLNSILTWPAQSGLAAEAFGRLDHTSGLFLKGTFGGVDIGSGHMHDEDTAAAMAPDPFSNTISSTRNGRDIYATLDAGYKFLHNRRGSLGGFVGFGHYAQRINAYGCEQFATGPICVPAGSVNPSALTLGETEEWNALRLGVSGGVMLTEHLNFSGEAAWLPYARLYARDNHWLRTTINPLVETGHGSQSYQVESTLTYAVTDRWRIGAGVRYLSLEAKGATQFPAIGLPDSPENFESSRVTAFLQASYRFGD